AFLTRAENVPGLVVTKFDRPTCIGSFPVRLGRLTKGPKEARSPNRHWLSHLGVYHGSIDMSILCMTTPGLVRGQEVTSISFPRGVF
ncbi:hypothetical protein LCGC14_1313100, partial [marine sediment metagenome]